MAFSAGCCHADDLAGRTDDLLRRRSGRLWMDRSGQPPDVPWGGENLELIEFHRYMSGIRKRCPAFRNGSLKALAAGDGYIAYGRFQSAQRAGGACCGVTAVNTGDDWLTLKIPVWQIGARDGRSCAGK